MDRDKKHIIPRDQYRRKRRVFSEDDNQQMEPQPETEGREQARRHQAHERTREFQSGPEARRQSQGDEDRAADDNAAGGQTGRSEADAERLNPELGAGIPAREAQDASGQLEDIEEKAPGMASHTDPDLNANLNPEPGPEHEPDTDPEQNAAPTPNPNQPTQEQKAQADPDRDFGPGESGYEDRSAPAGSVGVIPAGNAGGDNIGPNEDVQDRAREKGDGEPPRNNGTGNNKGGGGRKGCLGALLLPLIMGALGALAVLLLFQFFGDDEAGTGIQDGEQTAVESDEEAMSDQAREEIDGIKSQIQEDSGDSEKEVTDTTAAIQKAKKSVVSVINMQKAGQFMPGLTQNPEAEAEPEEAGTGSGVIYKLTDDKAYIVTNNHVVEGAEELEITLASGEQIPASLVGSDVWTDLAVLEVERGEIESAIEFADSDELLVGETAIAIGSPLGEAFSGSVSRGIVSGLDRSVPVDIDGDGNYDWEANVIQTDAAINPGNSGGALVNASGNLIGINSMKISMPTVEGIGFAIPSNEVREIVKQLEENGEVTRPYLGIQLQDLYAVPTEIRVGEMNLPEDVQEGVVISNVESGTPAADAGLQQFDVIVSLDGEAVPNMLQLRKYLYYEKAQGEEMTLEFYRDGELQETTVTLE